MQIQLKQTEIIAALKQYITIQGISLSGKSVDISFTAGRKEAGITADISIEDAGQPIPGFEDSPEDAVKPVLTVVPTPPEAKAAEEQAPAVEEPPFATDEPAVAKTPTSLFN
jgi:hypothetical protein